MVHITRTMRAGLAALTLGGAALAWTAPAEAGASTGTWRNGMVEGPYGPGYYGRGGYYGGPRHYGGYGRGYRGVAVYGGDCYMVRRRVVDDWGRVYIRRTRVCD